jgi:hypothetical protein
MAKKEEATADVSKMSVTERRALNRKEFEAYMSEKVNVNIPLGAEAPGTTTTASCDGKVYEIELGKTVQVPRKVAEVINRSIDANYAVQEKMQKMSKMPEGIGEY